MSILHQSDSKFTTKRNLLYGNTSFDNNRNTLILDPTVDYMISTARFGDPLFSCY